MIIKTFDNGWGTEYPAKRFEQELVISMLKTELNDHCKTVMINSVWYTQEYHQQVLAYLEQHQPDRIILVAMLDAAIPKPEWFTCKDIVTAGYYSGKYELDYWALLMDKYFSKLPEPTPANLIDRAYMCLNRKPHWHRMRLYKRLDALGLLDHGMVSMGSESGPALRTLDNDTVNDNLAPNAGTNHYGIPNDLTTVGNMQHWQRCFINVVTETVFDIDSANFVSEKIYKPIVGCRPFFVFAPNGASNWLHKRGFETYLKDFADITDLDPAIPEQLPQVLLAISQQPNLYWQKKYVELKEKILYNRNRFDIYAQEQWKKVN